MYSLRQLAELPSTLVINTVASGYHSGGHKISTEYQLMAHLIVNTLIIILYEVDTR